MLHTARRRWSRELELQVDGLAFASHGPVVLHGYEEPAGGRWRDSVIPGKLGAFDRKSGEPLWWAPCEVGYGRGFAAGICSPELVCVLGPSLSGGHLITHSLLENGQFERGVEIPRFDEGTVGPDLCICADAARVFAVDTLRMHEVWEYRREGERYHQVTRSGERVAVAYSDRETGRQGVLRLDARTGAFESVVFAPLQPSIHGLAAGEGALVVLTSEIGTTLPLDASAAFEEQLEGHPDRGERDTLSLVALGWDGEAGDLPLWFQVLETREQAVPPEASVLADGGKLYLERGSMLSVVDVLTGRPLGAWTVPGLDDRLEWTVADGAGLLAEETRVSVFELPA